MLALALEVAVRACMDNHTYSLGTCWKRQTSGGAIGLKLTGAIAKVFMVWWCRVFGQTLRAVTSDIGLPDLDALLGGGFRQGQVTELCGASPSGKTQLCHRLRSRARPQQAVGCLTRTHFRYHNR